MEYAVSKCEETFRFASLASCYVPTFPHLYVNILGAADSVEKALRWWLKWGWRRGTWKWKIVSFQAWQTYFVVSENKSSMCVSSKACKEKDNKSSQILITSSRNRSLRGRVACDRSVRLAMCVWGRRILIKYLPTLRFNDRALQRHTDEANYRSTDDSGFPTLAPNLQIGPLLDCLDLRHQFNQIIW